MNLSQGRAWAGCNGGADVWDAVQHAGEPGRGAGHHAHGEPRDGEAAAGARRHRRQLLHVRPPCQFHAAFVLQLHAMLIMEQLHCNMVVLAPFVACLRCQLSWEDGSGKSGSHCKHVHIKRRIIAAL